MLNWKTESLQAYMSKQISGIGLGLFRITFFSILLLEIIELFQFREIFFQGQTVLYSIGLFVWAVALLGVIAGVNLRAASLVNFLLTVLIIGHFKEYEYHIDYVYLGISFLSLWIPMGSRLSLDNYFGRTEVKAVPVVYYQILIFIGLASIYFESCFHKIESDVWIQGLGVWLPTSLPQFSSVNWGWMLENKALVLFLGYLTLFFEGSFVFLMWSKRFRLLLLLVGMGLHVGILVVYAIPYFALAMLSLYWLLVPDSWFKKLGEFSQKKLKKNPVGSKTAKRLQWLLGFILTMQILALSATPQVEKLGERLAVIKAVNWASQQTVSLRVFLLGMAKHEMFVDAHFKLPKTQYEVDAVLDTDGKIQVIPNVLGNYINGRKWVFWLFRLGRFTPEDEFFQKSVSLYLDKWISDNPDLLKRANEIVFRVREREHKIDNIQWEAHFAAKKKEQKWEDSITATKNDSGYLWMAPSNGQISSF